MKSKNPISEYLSQIGKRGGAAGKGEKKVRGDKSYYSAIASERWARHRAAKAAPAGGDSADTTNKRLDRSGPSKGSGSGKPEA